VRTSILNEATRLFGQKGYGSASVRELVEAAGVTKPVLYYYFGSKAGLFVATAEAHLEALDDMAREALAGGASLEDKLAALLLAEVEFARRRPDVWRFLLTCLHQVAHGQPRTDLMSVDATLMRYLGQHFYDAAAQGVLAKGVDVPLAAVSFLGVLRSWSIAAFHGAPIPTGFHTTVVHQFLHGIVDP
jgi:AcrR family transcriptional regulator